MLQLQLRRVGRFVANAMEPGFDIRHVARLARLQLSAEEEARTATQLTQILTHFAALAALPSGTLAEAHEVADAALRGDQPGPTLPPEALLRNAPAQREGQVLVPRVVDDAS